MQRNSGNSEEVILLDSDDEDDSKAPPVESCSKLFPDISIHSKPSEVKVLKRFSPSLSRKRPRTARKSLSSFTPQLSEEVVILLSDDDSSQEPPPSSEEKTPHLHDAFQQLMNQILLALHPEKDAMRAIENDLTKAFKAMNIHPKDISSLYAYLLQRTLNLSLDSSKVFFFVEEVKEKFSSLHCDILTDQIHPNETPSVKRIRLTTLSPTKLEETPKSANAPLERKPPEKSSTPLPKKVAKQAPLKKANGLKKSNTSSTTSSSSKTELHLKKLKAALEECGKEISRLELAEVDTFDEDSSYVLLCRFKKRFMTIYNKIIELEDGLPKWKSQVVSLQTLGSHQIKKFKTQISRHPEINKRIADFINKGIKKSLNSSFFPDFQDIHKIFSDVNKSLNLGLQKEELYHEASDAFQEIGKKLQSRRKFDVYASMESYLEENASDPDLPDDIQKKLIDNQALAEKSLDKVIQDFTLRQVRGIETVSPDADSASTSKKEEESGNEDEDELESESSNDEDNSDNEPSALLEDSDLPSSDDSDEEEG